MEKGDPLLDMPHADPLIVTSWHECGRYSSNGMGVSPLAWQEIRAYSNGRLSEWECLMLRYMSNEYCTEKQAATDDLTRFAPYQDSLNDAIQRQREQVAKSMKGAIRSRRS